MPERFRVQTFRFRVREEIVGGLQRKGVLAARAFGGGTVFEIPGDTKDEARRRAIEWVKEVEKETRTQGEYRDPNRLSPVPVEDTGGRWDNNPDLHVKLSLSPSERTLHEPGEEISPLLMIPIWLAGMAVLWIGLPLAALAVLVFVVKRLWYWF